MTLFVSHFKTGNRIYNQVLLIDTVAMEMCVAIATVKMRSHLHRASTTLDL